MELTFIGTGDCAGIPVYGCTCDACKKAREVPTKARKSCCGLLTTATETILIDAGVADISLRFPIPSLSRILLSHYHIDHVIGLFPLRWGCSDMLQVHGPCDPEGCADLFQYPGLFDFSDHLFPFIARTLGDVHIIPLPLNHSKPSLGYAITSKNSRLAWLCDTGGLPQDTLSFLRNWQPDIMVLDCTFPPQHQPPENHNDFNSALFIHEQISPGQSYLIHIGHQMELWLQNNENIVPGDISIARDDQVIIL